MKVAVRDPNALRMVRPSDLSAYLRQRGWHESSRSTYSAVWERQDFEILVPLDSTFKDYVARVSDATQVLSIAEERSELDVLEDLTNAGADIVRLRIIDCDLENGSIPLDEAAVMGSRARDLMLAAACAETSRKSVFGTRKPDEAIRYLHKLRMGQTEHGSFVLKLLSPVPPRLDTAQAQSLQPQIAAENFPASVADEPYQRRVTLRLARALRAVQQAAMQAGGTGDFGAFTGIVNEGVSANLCEALSGLAGSEDLDRRLEISLSWALIRPLRVPDEVRVVFSPEHFPIMSEAARIFREHSPREEFEVFGPIVRLERGAMNEAGFITVHTFVDEQPRKVSLQLEDQHYQQALQAHGKGQVVRCYGRLIKDGRTYRLENPNSFEVDEEES